MLIEGLKQQRQFALNNPKAFDLSYIFVMYGFDIIEKVSFILLNSLIFSN